MKSLIYQFWKGSIPAYAELSSRLFREYAARHGADYRFDKDPEFFTGKYSEYYHAMRPIYDDSFLEYDRVIFFDGDVFPKSDASADILTLPVDHIGMVEELVPEIRADRPKWLNDRNDERWAKVSSAAFRSKPPRFPDRKMRAYNSGVIVYTREGLIAARRNFPSIKAYSLAMRIALLPRFYRLDQNFLGTACFRKGMRFTVLDQRWNRIVKAATLDQNQLVKDAWSDTAFVHWQVRNKTEYAEQDIIDLVESA